MNTRKPDILKNRSFCFGNNEHKYFVLYSPVQKHDPEQEKINISAAFQEFLRLLIQNDATLVVAACSLWIKHDGFLAQIRELNFMARLRRRKILNRSLKLKERTVGEINEVEKYLGEITAIEAIILLLHLTAEQKIQAITNLEKMKHYLLEYKL